MPMEQNQDMAMMVECLLYWWGDRLLVLDQYSSIDTRLFRRLRLNHLQQILNPTIQDGHDPGCQIQ